MTQLENNLKILNELDSHWLETVSNEMKKENGTTTPELVKAYNRLWRTLRAAFKEDKELALEIFQNNTEGDGTWLLKDIENSLKIYFSFSCLRKIQEKQSEQVKTVLDYVFENAILYYDPQFMNEYEKCCKSTKCIGEFLFESPFFFENYVERSGRGNRVERGTM